MSRLQQTLESQGKGPSEADRRCAVYMRVSTSRQDTDSQKKAINDYLSGHEIVVHATQWYIDGGVSGAIMSRPGFDSLQREIFNGRINTVVMYDLSRFARNMIDGLVRIETWAKSRCTMVFVADAMEVTPGTWAGDVVLKILTSVHLAMAEGERNKTLARIQSGIESHRQKADLVREMHETGATLEQIIEAFPDYNPKRIERILETPKGTCGWGGKRRGLEADKKAPPRVVSDMVCEGLNGRAIGELLGVSYRVIQRKIRELGGKAAIFKANGLDPSKVKYPGGPHSTKRDRYGRPKAKKQKKPMKRLFPY